MKVRRGRNRKTPVIVTALVAAGTACAAVVVLWPNAGTAVTEEDAIARFHAEGTSGTQSGVSGTLDAGGVGSVPGPAAVVDPSAVDGGSAPPGASPATGGSLQPSPISSPFSAAAPGAARPAEGVYAYTAMGSENVSLGPATQKRTLPATVTATVRHSGACWTFTHDIFVEHVEVTEYCSAPDGVLRVASHTKRQQLGVVTATASLTCSPAEILAPVNGTARWATECRMQTETPIFTASMAQVGSVAVVGEEDVVVGDRTVPAVHVRMEREVSGDMTGHWHEDIWFSRSNHTIVRIERDVALSGPAKFTEQTAFTLRSLEPRS